MHAIIRKGRPEEFDAIRRLYDICAVEVLEWDWLPNGCTGSFPGDDLIRESLAAGGLFVAEISDPGNADGAANADGADNTANTGSADNAADTANTADTASADAGDCIPGELVGALIANHESMPEYKITPWNLPEAGDEDVYDLHALRMRKKCQGHGFAKALMQAAIEDARARGLKGLRLDTVEGDAAAVYIYEALGFKEICRRDMYYDDIGHVVCVFYELAF